MIDHIVRVHAIMMQVLKAEIDDAPIISDWHVLRDYLHAAMATLLIEQTRVLYLNSRRQLVRDEIMTEGTVHQVTVYVREIMRRALELGSTGLIVVHNHPSGDPTPSRADIAATHSIAAAGARLNVHLYDHIIVSTSGMISLREQGLI